MAKPQQNPADLAKQAGKLGELKARLLFLIGALIVYRVGTFIPVPGVDPAALATWFEQQSGGILGMFNMFSGGALSRFGIFALGIIPYISSSIIMQMASHIVPQLQQLRKEGEQGRRQIVKYTRYGTVLLASFQSIAAANFLQSQGTLVVNPGPAFLITACITLVTGTVFLMWLGEQITERGIGNGISMIILASIVAGLPAAIAGTAELVSTGEMSPITAILMLVGIIFAYHATGSLNIDSMAGVSELLVRGGALAFFLVFIAVVAELKVFPANGWALDIYESAHPAFSALVSAATGTATLFAIDKLLLIGDQEHWDRLQLVKGQLGFLTRFISLEPLSSNAAEPRLRTLGQWLPDTGGELVGREGAPDDLSARNGSYTAGYLSRFLKRSKLEPAAQSRSGTD